MRGRRRLTLRTGQVAAQYCREHPDTNPATAQVPERLYALVDRGEILAELWQSSQAIVAAAVVPKAELRAGIDDKLQALQGMARAAAKDHPEVTVHRRGARADGRVNETSMLTSGRVAVAEAPALKELLSGYGLVEEQLTALTADLDAYEAALARQRAARTAQVTASAELDQVLSDTIAVIRNLDAVHRTRFRDQPQLLAAWKSARRVAWPGTEAEPAPAPDPNQPRAA